MKLDEFPPDFKAELDKRTQPKAKKSSAGGKGRDSDVGCGLIACIMIGSVVIGLFCGLEIMLLTFVVALIVLDLMEKSHKKNVEKNIEKMKAEAEKEYLQYVSEFETTAQKMSSSLLESPLVLEVVDWMINGVTTGSWRERRGGFAEAIDAADRSSHIHEINISFNFHTCRDKIKCSYRDKFYHDLGCFDFDIKRCDKLETPLEQAALTRAIASAIQRNITMKYPQDVSGTNVVTSITYGYEGNTATIKYTAPNGNYKETRSWAAN